MVTRTAFLTGVTGFIGGRLAERLLADGWAVHALVRETSDTASVPSQVVIHRDDGTADALAAILRQVRPDIVFHLASLYLNDHLPDQVDALVASNILLPVRLAEAMTLSGSMRLINTGTAWQHFGGAAYHPVNLYAATKQACVDLLRFFHEARGLSVVTLKLFDTYGAGDKRRKLVQLLVDAAMKGEPIGMSPGDQVVDMTHVDDVVEAFVVTADLLLSSSLSLDAEYLVSGERVTVRELTATIEKALNRTIAAEFGARPYRTREVMLPVAATSDRRLPGWRAYHTITTTIPDLIRR